ncbi:MAG: hypothetical protein RLZZ450_7382 [Pseudomonadota bacterium]|jgi:hypothetical protein
MVLTKRSLFLGLRHGLLKMMPATRQYCTAIAQRRLVCTLRDRPTRLTRWGRLLRTIGGKSGHLWWR